MPKKGRQTTRMTPGFTGPFKGEPQQGTLFDKRAVDQMPGNQAQTDQRVGPRGYSVERSRQFQNVLPPVQAGLREAEPGERIGGIQGGQRLGGNDMVPSVKPGEHQYGPVDLGPKGSSGASGAMRRGRSKMIDTLARSTVDPDALKGLNSITVKGQHSTRAGAYFPTTRHIELHASDETGTEQYPPDRVKNPAQRTSVQHDPEITLVHEVGHHISTTQGNWHARYSNPTEQAGEEGFADNFAMTHWRADPRHQTWHGEYDPRRHTYGGRKAYLASYPEYQRNLGDENKSPGERAYVTPADESRDRPILGHGTGIFDTAIPKKIQEGFSSSWMSSGQEPSSSGTEAENAWYGRRRQDTNRAIFHSAERPIIQPRWQVRRQSLGRQF